MSAGSDSPPSGTPLRLHTFGTLVLRGADGDALWADYGQQGWRLALLAVLAAAGDRGCSRDRLLLLFWPDASQQQARHSLEQLLYKMRKSLPASPFLGVNPLRLDPAVVTSDVGDFERALAAGDAESAVGHYRGSFLDGFYLGDSPEFEEWMLGERARLEAEYAKALEGLARSRESRGDHATAAGWWARLYALDSLSGRNALGLMRALASSGDYSAALRHAEQYERRVAQELGTSAGPEIAALAAEIRGRAQEEPPAVGTTGISSPPLAKADLSTSLRPATTSPIRTPVRRRFHVAIGALAIAAGVFALTQFNDTPAGAPAAAALESSIAVLPLANLSADPGDAALADGMTEELIGVLSRTGNLRVIAGTSVFALKDRVLDVRQIADSLRVSHVVEGGLQKVGSRLRMQIRLVDARDGSTRWSETYDREFQDVFAVQEEIARAVARELDVQLAGGTAKPSVRHQTRSIAAYDYYLRGIDAGFRQHDHHEGARYFERAIAADPDYAAAYAALARMLVLMGNRPDRNERLAEAEDMARKALALDDSLAEAHEAMGWVYLAPKDFRSSEAYFKRAIALDPRYSHAHEGLAQLYLWLNRPVDQLTEARLALQNDPFSHTAIREMARALLVNGRYDEARDRLRPLKELSPPVGYAGLISGQTYIMEENWPAAIAELRWAEEHTAGHAPAFLGYALARAGRLDEARAVLSDLMTGEKYSAGAFGIAIVYTGLRDYDQAFAWLDRAAEQNELSRDLMLPIFADLHRDPRFERLKARLGLPGG